MFKKLDPEEARLNREKIAKQIEAKQASQRRMADHLKEQVDEDAINNDWEREFVLSIHARVHSALPYLSDKQDEILTRLFEKY